MDFINDLVVSTTDKSYRGWTFRVNMMHRACLLILLIAFAGCGTDGPQLAEVSGVITVDGKPVPNTVVTFIPTGGSTSYGKTDAEGKYTLRFTEAKMGAMIGKHTVELEVRRYSPSELAEMKAAGEKVSTENVAIPRKYKAAGALTAEVKEGSNTIDFKLTSN